LLIQQYQSCSSVDINVACKIVAGLFTMNHSLISKLRDAAEATAGDSGYGSVLAAIMGLVTVYLEEALDEPPGDVTPQTSFMDAGLDSLDLLKVRILCRNE
jgi:Phosphopantetheine attachment site